MLPGLGENARGLAVEEPVHVFVASQKDTSQNQTHHTFGMRLRIGKRQGRTPGSTKHDPAINFQEFTNFFKIGNQIPGRVLFQARMRSRFSATALIKEDDAV